MNSAKRILGFVQGFDAANQNHKMRQIWQDVLDLEKTPDEEEVHIAIQGVLAELRTMQARCRQLKIPEENFSEALTILRAAFSPTQLSQPWSNHKPAMASRSVPLTLMWMGWALSQFDEPDVSAELLSQLQESLSALEHQLVETELPLALRDMLERQATELKIALTLYKVQGVKPVADAVHKQVSEMRHAPSEIIEQVNAGGPAVQSVVQTMLRTVGEAAKFADAGSKVVKFSKEIIELGMNGWQAGQQILIAYAQTGS